MNRTHVCECSCLPCVRAGYHWPDECGVGTGVNVFRDKEAASLPDQSEMDEHFVPTPAQESLKNTGTPALTEPQGEAH